MWTELPKPDTPSESEVTSMAPLVVREPALVDVVGSDVGGNCVQVMDVSTSQYKSKYYH